MIPKSDGLVNLTSDLWKVDDFFHYLFIINQKPGEVLYRNSSNNSPTAIADDLDKVCAAFDQIAYKEIEEERQCSWNILNLYERIQRIREYEDHLDHLEQNLSHHEQFLDDYGSNGHPGHAAALKEIASQKVCLDKVKDDLHSETKHELEKLIRQFKNARLTRGTDYRKFILKGDILVQILNQINLGNEVVAVYNGLLMENFLHSLSSGLTLSPVINIALKKMGYKENDIKKKLSEIAPKISDFFHSIKKVSVSPLKLFEEVQRKIEEFLFKALKIDNESLERLTRISEKLFKAEKEYHKKFQKLLFKFKNDFKEHRKQDAQIIEQFDPASDFPSKIENYLEHVEKQQVIDKLENYQAQDPSMDDISVIFAGEVLTQNPWFARNYKYTSFCFTQDFWGRHFDMDEGVCKALNYRWIKLLLQNPSKPIHAIEDLDHNAKVTDKNTLITQSDRKIQAEYMVKGKMKMKQNKRMSLKELEKTIKESNSTDPAAFLIEKDYEYRLQMPPNILKRDGYNEKVIFPFEKFIKNSFDLIDHINIREDQDPFLKDSNGILEIDIARIRYWENKPVGFIFPHAIGLQIDKSSNTFRFWDVSSGLYTFPSLDLLIKEFNAYLHDRYSNYDCLSAVQYTKSK